ncbi:Lipase, GDSL [Corchorus olitorius]|uniref:Lipase, GDSL n=1 Tax=Corchorus olitorius TaxID=93759 RepID=A0A1R3IR83_9ROSI|nr:Lipase, GDSL [Corchorus olitorius]
MASSTTTSLNKWLPKPNSPKFVVSLFLFISYFLNVLSSNYANNNILSTCKFDAIYQLGDSISDTGNYIQMYPSCSYASLPYGVTLNKATGRCSNGLLIIDYLAQSAEIPLLDAYLNKNGAFDHGVNFAVAGAYALPTQDPQINFLSQQVDWMVSYFNTTCRYDKDCLKKNERALFVIGEIGGNDYNFAFWRRKTLDEVKAMVPKVVEAIKYAVRRAIEYGATRIIVPGNFPIGCFTVFVTKYPINDTNAYDELHCLKYFNNFAIYQNDLLQKAIEELKEEYPNVIIVYGDYYNAFLWLFSKANMLGFDPTSLQKACCGIGGDYNFNVWIWCGDPIVPIWVSSISTSTVYSLSISCTMHLRIKALYVFFSKSAGIPLLDAYLNKNGSFDHGINFAVAKATALPEESDLQNNLSEQLDWMRVIEYGATRIIVPGNFPIGCFPAYLNRHPLNDTSYFDELHCVKRFNDFAIYQNDLLQQAIEELKEEYPNVIIVYGDYNNAFLWLFSNANMFGFNPKSLQKACCGIGGDYNFNWAISCGDLRITVCSNPNERVSWDGIHLTQRAYELIADQDIYPKLQCERNDLYRSVV